MKSIFCALIIALATVAVTAQTPPPPKPKPQADDAPIKLKTDPLKLTDAELSDLANLATRANQASDELQGRLRLFLSVACTDCDEASTAYAIKLAGDDARKYWREVARPAQQAYLTRLAEIQKAHDCVGCALRDGAFVKPAKAEKPE